MRGCHMELGGTNTRAQSKMILSYFPVTPGVLKRVKFRLVCQVPPLPEWTQCPAVSTCRGPIKVPKDPAG